MGKPKKKMKAIDYLRKHDHPWTPLVPAEDVQRAAALHDACKSCGGFGGTCYYPELPCPECGFTFADSYGLEKIERG